ncbi:ATPase [Solibacillus sp. FSL H8-0523]|uniref:ATPase n=1 Tax=Solibacillus sp. FSL H8-0523 TaxID=2954511 RepID=UPI003101786A
MNDSGLWISLGINLVIILILTIGFRRYYRNKPKVDQGFKIAYYGLSYRRKFWRTIYSLPLLLVYIVLMYFLLGLDALFIGFVIFAGIIFIVQAYYNYVKWQEEEKLA